MVRVVFLHPDLGIGGAERAVIDIALALKSSGHSAMFITSHHDISHCFPETKDGTLHVTTVGDWLPRNIFGRCSALCAYVRMIVAAVYLILFSGIEYDYVFCDQISACIPVLRLRKQKVIFYCHFPDLLLTQRHTFLKTLYRAPIDWIEEKTTGLAHCVLVNSHFTAGVFRETFQSLHHIEPQILYPIPDLSSFAKPCSSQSDDVTAKIDDLIPNTAQKVFVSLNRYTRAKNHALAIKALGELKKVVNLEDAGVHLVVIGGHDVRVRENRQTYDELIKLTADLHLSRHVTFIKSCTHELKVALLTRAVCLLYTPDREHFGIVPVEAMYLKCPVIAVNSGGPKETIADGETGFLCEGTPSEFCRAMEKIIGEGDLHKRFGEAGRSRVDRLFSRKAFTSQVMAVVSDL